MPSNTNGHHDKADRTGSSSSLAGPVSGAGLSRTKTGGNADGKKNPGSFDGAAVWRAVQRRWLPALVLGLLLGGTGAAAAWFLVPARHTGTTLLNVEANQPAILFGSPEGANKFANYQRAQIARLKSRLVLTAALRQPRVANLRLVREQSDPVAWLEKELKADYSLAPEVLRISLTAATPDDLAELLNAVRDAYLNDVVEKDQNEQQTRKQKLETLATDYEEQLRDKRRTLRDLAESVGSGDSQTLAHKQQFLLERLALTQKELLQLQSELRKAKVEAAGFPAQEKAVADQEVPEALVQEQVQKDPVVMQQQAEVARLESAYETAKQGFVKGDQEPLLQRYRGPLAAARQALADREKELRPAIVAQLREKAKQSLALTAAQAQNKIVLLENLEAQLIKDVNRGEQETRTLNKGSVDLEAIRQDIAQIEEVAKKASAQVEAMKVETHAPARITKMEEAFVSDADGQKKRMMTAGGVGVGLLAAVAFGLVWWELRARRITSLRDVKEGLGVRVLGRCHRSRLTTARASSGRGRPGAPPARSKCSRRWTRRGP